MNRTIDEEVVGACAQRLLGALSGAATSAMVVLGERLGLYRALQEGPATAEELAGRTDTSPRYVREWLSQQAAAGLLTYAADDDRFAMPVEHALVLAVAESPAFLAPGTTVAHGWFLGIDRLVQAFRDGHGVAWEEQPRQVFDGTERFFRPGYAAHLISEWLPSIEGAHERLTAGARVADVGCGHGAALVLMAQAHPRSTFVGYDFHERSVEIARMRVAEAGVGDRVDIRLAGTRDYTESGFDLVFFFDTLHDLGDPIGAARHAREALVDGGALVLVEPRTDGSFAENLASPLAALNFTASTFQCTPTALAQHGGVALGAQAGEAAITEVLRAAGFTTVRRVAESEVNVVYEARS